MASAQQSRFSLQASFQGFLTFGLYSFNPDKIRMIMFFFAGIAARGGGFFDPRRCPRTQAVPFLLLYSSPFYTEEFIQHWHPISLVERGNEGPTTLF